MQKPPLPLRVNVSSTFTAEPLERSLTWWIERLGWSPQIEFAPFNQVFQQLLDPTSAFGQERDGVNVALIRLEDWSRRGAHRSADATRDRDDATFVLPNGMEVSQLNRYETEYVYQEIFEDRAYLRHGITIEDGDCVVDIGANIGLFSLFVSQHAPLARVFACEPSPAAFAVLQRNLSRHAPMATPLNCGVGDANRTTPFTAYARSSVFSSFHADAAEDRDAVRAVVRNVLREQGGVATDALDSLTDTLVAGRMESSVVDVQMRTLSSIISAQGLERVDLLKIDAEKSELQILRGIEAADWPRIRQIVVEVHDTTGTVLPEVRKILDANGFDLTGVDEESLLEGSGLFNVYAVHRSAPRRADRNFEKEVSELKRTAADLAAAVRASSVRTTVPHVVVICPGSPRTQADPKWTAACREVEEQIASDLADAPGVQIVTSEALLARYPDAASHDVRAESLGGIPYTRAGFAAIGAQVGRAIYAARRPAAKVIVVDCDQTLWEGVVGEDGPAGVRVGAPQLALQRFLVEQHALGRLICLCSKNEESDVLSVFRSRTDFTLTLDHITAWRINWENKSANLRALASDLDLGLDSFVFIDDNPAECAEVRSACPEVVAVQWPAAGASVDRLLQHLWPCDARGRVTAEDQQRTAMYRRDAERSRSREQATSFEVFLSGLELEVEIAPLSAETLGRAAQLTERTNQFNFTTIRRSEAQLGAARAEGGLEFLTIRVSDRFGDYGLVGLVGFACAAGRLKIDTFLLSCRVLGKGVEHRIIAHLGALAQERGWSGLDLPFAPTKRNTPALRFAKSIEQFTTTTSQTGLVFSSTAAAAASVRFDPSHNELGPTSESAPSLAGESLMDPAFLATIHDSWSTSAQVLADLDAREDSSRLVTRPRTVVEETLVRIWRECLGLTPGIDENYFDLGGDSIRAVQIASRGHAEGLRFTPKDVLDLQTIDALARLVGASPVAAPAAISMDTSSVEADDPTRRILFDLYPALTDAFALTPMQMMFYAQYSAGLDVGFEQWQFTVEGEFSVPDYRRAWEQVVVRHDALRTAFQSKGLTQPWQVVVREASLPWHEENIADCAEHDQARIINTYAATDRGRRFNLAEAPLMRLGVFALGANRWRVVWTFHHLVIDGWSCPIVLAEVAHAYGSAKSHSLPRTSFKVHVAWRAAAVAHSEEFWRVTLAGVSPTPIAHDLTAVGGAEGESHATIPEAMADTLTAYARTQRVTLGTLCQTAWALMLSHLSGRDDVMFGLTMSGRPPEIPAVENIVGTFINNVPIRMAVPSTDAMTTLLTGTQRAVNRAAEHQFLALARIQELSGVPARERLFDSLLVIQNYVGAGAAAYATLGTHARINSLEAPVRTGYPVTMVITPNQELSISLITRDGWWSDSTRHDVLTAFIELVQALAAGRDRTVAEVLRGLPDLARAVPATVAETASAFEQPRTALEADIATVWRSAFGHSAFGVDSNFFHLGGHSLLMLRVHDALQTRLDRPLSIVDLFEHPTIAGLANHLAGNSRDSRLMAVKGRAQQQLEALAKRRQKGSSR